jgi:indole-3-glycerol phosphate synthase
MNTTGGGGLAPAVERIIDGARTREPPDDGRVSVDARSLPEAIAASAASGRVPVIAEVKPTSPTTDGTRNDDPIALAEAMVDGGASALSVLTEPDHFEGSTDALRGVREAVDVPVLRKDFLLTEAQLDAVAADVVLLIARFLGSESDPDAGVDGADDLETMLAAARDRGFQALVEVHTEAELERALDAGATLVGINNRDLGALEVDLGTFERVADALPDALPDAARENARSDGLTDARSDGLTDARSDGLTDAGDDGPSGAVNDLTLVAESGIATTDDVARMRAAGADALLVGSAIMDGDVAANTRRLTEVDG